MDYLLFIIYLIFFSWLVTKTGFFTRTGLSNPQLVIIFLLKVIAGIFYGWMGHYYGSFAQMADTWNYHLEGLVEYRLLLENPKEYLTNLFHNPYESGGFSTFFASRDSYWNDLKLNVFLKILSIFNIFSFGEYYVNVIFYVYITLFGPMAFYRVMANIFPGNKKLVLIATFLVPSFLYWGSGLHKEGLIFTGIALILYHLYYGFRLKKSGAGHWLGLLLGLFILFLLRNFILFLILPAILAWLLASKWPRRSLLLYGAVYLAGAIAFFTLPFLDPRLDFPGAVVNKQQAFVKLIGQSSIPISKLEPDFPSFFKNIPQAITLSTIRPYPSDIKHLLSMAAAIEIEFFLLLFLLFLIFRKRKMDVDRNSICFCLFFSLSLLLAIGYTVNNLGAIVRYRSVVMPMLVVLMVVMTDWEKISTFIGNYFKKNDLSKS